MRSSVAPMLDCRPRSLCDGLHGRVCGLVSLAALPIEPVTAGSAKLPNAAARDSNVAWRRISVIEFLLELLLIEQLAAHGAVDLSAQFGDAVLIAELLLRLPRDQRSQHIVAKRQIGRRRDRPPRHDDDGADRDPKGDGTESDLASGMRDRIGAAGWLAGAARSCLVAANAVARGVRGMRCGMRCRMPDWMLRRMMRSCGLCRPRRCPLRHCRSHPSRERI